MIMGFLGKSPYISFQEAWCYVQVNTIAHDLIKAVHTFLYDVRRRLQLNYSQYKLPRDEKDSVQDTHLEDERSITKDYEWGFDRIIHDCHSTLDKLGILLSSRSVADCLNNVAYG